ncbi:MAG: TRAP transporter substrate-binding protein DctP [Lachnospiraceae bacterium]|nr:TRAP transporter substrate-binding protein DctP [Lachnospiraceae bacterium]
MKKIKNIFALLLVLSMLVALCACGGSSTTTTTAGTDSASSDSSGSTASTDDVYKLSFTIHDPSTSAKTQLYQEKADAVYEATDGHLEITIYSSGTLVASTDVAEAIIAGTADMGWLFVPFFTNQFPLTEVVNMPLQFGDVYATSMTIRDLYQEYAELQEEWSNYKVLNIYSMPGNYLFTNFPVYTADDLVGKNIRTSSNVGTTMIGDWGAAVMTYGPGDIYEAMQKNSIDGFTFEYSGVKSFSLQEVVSYCTEMTVMTGPFVTAMNLDSWNSLPTEYQEVLEEYFGWNISEEMARVYEADLAAGKAACEEAGVEFIKPTDEQRATFQVAADEFIDNWCETYSTDGFDARAFYEHALELYDSYLPDSGLTDY